MMCVCHIKINVTFYYIILIHSVQKESNTFVFHISFVDKYYQTFRECPKGNRSTYDGLILTQLVKFSLCCDVIMMLL